MYFRKKFNSDFVSSSGSVQFQELIDTLSCCIVHVSINRSGLGSLSNCVPRHDNEVITS